MLGTTEPILDTETKLKRIAWLSSRDRSKTFNNVLHLINDKSLTNCFHELSGSKAVGIDGVTKKCYEENLSGNIQELMERLKRMSYRPGHVREVQIPKGDKSGATRPLGISNIEDKLVQKMMHKILESIYEPVFLDCSYGFRPNRGCHDAIKVLHNYLYKQEVEIVIDVDLQNYFNSIDHKLLEEILRNKIKDDRFMRYMIRLFKAGILANGELKRNEEGVVQGSICSPILANIFAHVAIDEWFEEIVKPRCKGKVAMFRYADDLVICCRYESDAQRIKEALVKRLSRYKLKLNEDKTRLVRFSKSKHRQGEPQETFDFLGFTFYWGRSQGGAGIVKIKTSAKRMRSKLKQFNEWLKRVRNKIELRTIWKQVITKLRGHIQYYGVSFNIRKVKYYIQEVKWLLFKALNRRSQKKSFNWEQFQLYEKQNQFPKAEILHALY